MSINTHLKEKITQMAKEDQKIREEQRQQFSILTGKDIDEKKYTEETSRMRGVMEELDKRHTEEMRKIIEEYGWPGKKMVGAEANNYAWLLVQHAVHDEDFQKRCLGLLKQSIQEGDSEAKHAAYLEDRILVRSGLKQKYGTQFRGSKTGKQTPYPIEDLDNLEERRKSVGLGLFLEYKKRMENL